MKLEMETLKIASGPNGALLNELKKKTFDIRIRSDNVIGAAPVTSLDTFSYFFGICMSHRLWV